ncbi:MAG TPA: hypothetical protein VFF20_04690 [Pseudogracilibacillus sp.]|nr:hypothetical protein [Pseudogracilibacillus sp.]
MRKKGIFVIVSLLVLLAVLLHLAIGIYFYKLVIERGPKVFLQGNEGLEVAEETLKYFLEGDWIT